MTVKSLLTGMPFTVRIWPGVYIGFRDSRGLRITLARKHKTVWIKPHHGYGERTHCTDVYHICIELITERWSPASGAVAAVAAPGKGEGDGTRVGED